MRTFEQQLVSVGYRPSFQPSLSITHQAFAPVAASNRKVFEHKSLEEVLGELFEPVIKPRKVRKIVVSKAGSHYKARWGGTPNACFGITPAQAIERLNMCSESTISRGAMDRAKYGREESYERKTLIT